MSARNRYREQRQQFLGTRYDQYGNSYSGHCTNGDQEWCDDNVNQRDEDNPFLLTTWIRFTPLLDGEYWNQYGTRVSKFEMYPIDYQVSPSSSTGHFGSLDLENLARRAAALSNPSRAYVSLPQFVGEFKDFPELLKSLPQMIKKNGDSILKKAASGHLNWRFAIAPLLDDLKKLWKFQDGVNKRIKMLEKLREEKQLRRRAGLGEDSDTTTQYNQYLQSAGTTLKADRITVFKSRVWATTRWKLNIDAELPQSEQEIRQYAKNLAAGMNSQGAMQAAWELIPWSWLVDWFVPVGDYLASNNNSVPVHCSSICVMRTTSSRSKYRYTNKPTWYQIIGPLYEAEIVKVRHVVSPTILLVPPLADLSFLTKGQLSILGSLAILRGSFKR